MNIIEQVRAGNLAIQFDKKTDSVEDLNRVLKYCFPKDKIPSQGSGSFYAADRINPNGWADLFTTSLPALPLQNFLGFIDSQKQEPQEGDLVLVSDNGEEWAERIFLCKVPRSKHPYHTVGSLDEEVYIKTNYAVDTSRWKYIKLIPKAEEMTLEQVCKELGEDKMNEILSEKIGKTIKIKRQ